MFFDNLKDAKAYAKSLTLDMQGVHKHKAVACNQWRFDRVTGEYALHACYMIVLGR